MLAFTRDAGAYLLALSFAANFAAPFDVFLGAFYSSNRRRRRARKLRTNARALVAKPFRASVNSRTGDAARRPARASTCSARASSRGRRIRGRARRVRAKRARGL